MAATTEITAGAGLRLIQVFALDSDGYPTGDQVTLATPYDGEQLLGARSLNMNLPGVRPIVHVGDDRVQAVDYLPPSDAASGEILTNRMNLTLDAILTDTIVAEVKETQMGGMVTSKQGNEIDVAVLAYRQALDTAPGAQQTRRWQVHMFPVARLIPKGGSATEGGADENGYDIIPTVATAPPWGTAFTEVANGFTEAQYLRFVSQYPPKMNRFTGNGTLTDLYLANTPISVAKTLVTVDGVSVTVSSVDTVAKTATLASPPANATVVVAWYESSDDI